MTPAVSALSREIGAVTLDLRISLDFCVRVSHATSII